MWREWAIRGDQNMSEEGANDVTRCLQQARRGGSAENAQLLEVVYEELRRLAGSHLRRERVNHTLQPTALVHEAYLRLVDQKSVEWEDRSHFFGIATRIMRQVLVDHARRAGAAKRKKDRVRMTLERVETPSDAPDFDVLELDEALQKLTAMDERKGRVVELRFFGGLTLDEVAKTLGVSKRTAESDWFMARAWLRDTLSDTG